MEQSAMEQSKELSYKMPLVSAAFSFTEKKSEFIGRIYPVLSDSEAESIIESVRKSNPDARHNVFAYRLYGSVLREKFSDDGEPKGTGGKPCLDVLQKNDVHNALIVVTRYFGGILLGAPGLTRAYSKAAAGAFAEAEIIEMRRCRGMELTFGFDLYGKISRFLEGKPLKTEPPVFAGNVRLKLKVPVSECERLTKDIIDLTSAACELLLLEDSFCHIEG